jgi:hypothetical protein
MPNQTIYHVLKKATTEGMKEVEDTTGYILNKSKAVNEVYGQLYDESDEVDQGSITKKRKLSAMKGPDKYKAEQPSFDKELAQLHQAAVSNRRFSLDNFDAVFAILRKLDWSFTSKDGFGWLYTKFVTEIRLSRDLSEFTENVHYFSSKDTLLKYVNDQFFETIEPPVESISPSKPLQIQESNNNNV